jgi:uncharacterized protein (TIGR03382 family)
MMSPRRTMMVAFAAALVASPAFAFVREKTQGGVDLHWEQSSMPIAYALDSSPPDGSASFPGNSSQNRATVISQFQQWQSVACAKFSVAMPTDLVSANATAAIDGKSEIFWESNWTYGSAVLGVTTPAYDPTTGVIFEADMQFNNVDWVWQSPDTYVNCQQAQNGCADTASIALHEEGHFLGLAHSVDMNAVMYATWNGDPKRSLSADDTNGICAIFPTPVAGQGPQDSPCGSTADCMSGLSCATRAAASGGSICTQSCSGLTDTSCPAGDTCQQSNTGGFGCFPAPAGGTQGEACGPSASCADGFWCLGTNASRCYQDCDPTNPRCIDNLKCNAWSGSNVSNPPSNTKGGYCDGMPVKPAGASECITCDDATPCKAGLDCVPLNDASGASVCRNPCNHDSGCSLTNRCLPHDSFNSKSPVCACQADFGDLGGPCRSDLSCTAGNVCVDDGSSTGGICRRSCGGTLPACPTGNYCKTLGRDKACVTGKAPVSTPDAGMSSGQGAPSGGCSNAGPVTCLLLLGLSGLLRRRRG